MKGFAGSNKKLNIEEYNIGTMSEVVYDVNGGFEDWAYGASWDTKNVPLSCNRTEFLKENIKYADESNRAFVFLVEAGWDKTPNKDTLGNEIAILKPF